jgi:hypothetical protein
VRKVIGLSSSKGGEGVTVSNTWYALEFLTVAVHFLFCFAPPALLIGYALTVQHIYGLHLSPIAPDAPALTLLAAVQPYPTAPPSATSSLIAFRAALWGSIGMMGMSVFRLLFSYLDLQGSKKKNAAPGCSSVVGYVVRGAYAIALMVSMSVVFAWAGVVAAWFVLAAAIEPTRFLPFGIAVITVGVVGVTMASTMIAAAERLKEKLAAAFDLMLKHRLKRAMKKIEREVYLKSLEQGEMLASQWEDADVEAGGAAAAAAAQEEAKEKEVTPVDVFMALNQDGDDVMSMEEFQRLFELLELDLKEEQKEQLFAYCDIDCSGKIDEKEFADGWEKMVQIFLENSASGLGLSRLQIALAVGWAVLCLVLLVAFILITLSAWRNEGGFEVVVQSLLVSGTGKAVAAMRRRSKAEDKDSVGSLVEGIMSENQSSASEE